MLSLNLVHLISLTQALLISAFLDQKTVSLLPKDIFKQLFLSVLHLP